MKLTATQIEVLRAWKDTYGDFDILSFSTISKRSGVERGKIRRLVRDMARRGATQYHRACWTEDGDPAGSGYGLTPAGRAFMNSIYNP